MTSSGLVVRTWNDAPISRRDGDGYADATAMCQANGKLWADYQRLTRTTAYLQALAASLTLANDAPRFVNSSYTLAYWLLICRSSADFCVRRC
jgi:hypothetical protein